MYNQESLAGIPETFAAIVKHERKFTIISFFLLAVLVLLRVYAPESLPGNSSTKAPIPTPTYTIAAGE